MMETGPSPALLSHAAELIAASRQPLLVCHVAPDGDAIRSLLGLKWLLEARGKIVHLDPAFLAGEFDDFAVARGQIHAGSADGSSKRT